MLRGISPLLTPDLPEPGDSIDEAFRKQLIETISPWLPTGSDVRLLSRQDYYGEAAEAQVVVATGETAPYAMSYSAEESPTGAARV